MFSGAVEFRESQSLDTYGRLKVSEPMLLFDSHNQYGNNTIFWETSTSGSGTQTNSTSESAIVLSTSATSGDKVIRQTKHYFRYQAGKSQHFVIAFNLGVATSGLRRRVGLFDANNGIFLEQTSTGVRLITRTSASGSPVDTQVEQADWNGDKMDGTGNSGISLDFSKIQTMTVDFQFAGRIRVAFGAGGIKHTIHTFKNSNLFSTPIIANPHLPIRQEIENTSSTSGSNTMKVFSSAIATDGGFELSGITHAAGTGITATSVTTRRSVFSFRPKLTFNSVVNRGIIIPQHFEIAVASQNILYEIVIGGTLGGSPSWTSAGSNSIVEYDTAGTTVTGGETIDNGFAIAGQGKALTIESPAALFFNYPVSLNIAGDTQIIVSIVATAFTSTASVNAGATWREIW